MMPRTWRCRLPFPLSESEHGEKICGGLITKVSPKNLLGISFLIGKAYQGSCLKIEVS